MASGKRFGHALGKFFFPMVFPCFLARNELRPWARLHVGTSPQQDECVKDARADGGWSVVEVGGGGRATGGHREEWQVGGRRMAGGGQEGAEERRKWSGGARRTGRL